MKRRAALAAATLPMAAALVVGLSSPALANYAYNSTPGSFGMWIEVLETDGSVYKVWSGQYSASSPGIQAIRAPEGYSAYYKYVGASSTQPIKRCQNTRYDNGWCSTLGWSINVVSVKAP